MDVKARKEIVLEVARLFHLKDYIRAQKGKGRSSERAKTLWDELGEEDVEFYTKKVEPIIVAVLTAGFVILRQSEVSQAYLPLREQQVVRPVIRLPADRGRGGGYTERAQQERERRG